MEIRAYLEGDALVGTFLVYHVDYVSSMVVISIFQSASGNNSRVFPLQETIQFGPFLNLHYQDLVVINTFCKLARIAPKYIYMYSLHGVHTLI